jgi:heme-degrading monooxygenase HmoA
VSGYDQPILPGQKNIDDGSTLLVGSLVLLVAWRAGAKCCGMLYELRHYIPVPGKEAAILNRFKKHTFGIFKKYGFKTLNFWIDAKGSGQIRYVLVWESLSSMEKSWERFRRDQEWIEAKEATEKDGPIVERIESILLTQPDDIAASIA